MAVKRLFRSELEKRAKLLVAGRNANKANLTVCKPSSDAYSIANGSP